MSLTSKQAEYLQGCNHRWNVKTGATGSGKTFLDYTVVIPQRLTRLKGLGLVVMLGNTRGTLERNILEPMRQIWGEDLVEEIKSDNTVQLFGQKVYALGADNKKHVARIQGATIEYAYGDEVTTWNQEVFEMLKSRLRTSHSCFDGTCNPAGPKHWFKKFLDSDADIFQQSYNIYDGCLPPAVVEELTKEYSGTHRYQRYILGKWAVAEGLVYDMFSEEKHVCKAETSGEIIVSSDFGMQNATVFLIWQKRIDTGNWHCKKEYYYSGRENNHTKTVAELVRGLEDTLNGQKDDLVIVDPSAAALITELRDKGHKVKKADNAVNDGITDVETLLAQNKLSFDPSCARTIEEFGIYAWDPKASDKGKDEVIKQSDHGMDAIRYFVKTKKLVKRSKTRQYKSILG